MAENVQPTGQPGTEQDAEYWRQQAVLQQQQHEATKQQYAADMEKVYNVLTAQQQQQPQQPPQQPQQPEWDVTDPKAVQQGINQVVQSTAHQMMTPVVLALAQNQYESHMMNAKRDERMPYFAHWEQEIRQLAQGVQPGLLAEYNTIVNLYQLVASRHGNELVEMEVRKRLAAQQQQANSDEVEVEDDGEVPLQQERSVAQHQVTPPPQPQPPRQPPPAAPVQSMQPARSTRTQGARRLTREEAFMAQRMGLSLKEYANAKELGDVEI